LSNQAKSKVPGASPVQSVPGTSAKAEKVRSSRYEWEGKSNETEKASAASNGARRSMLASARALLKRLFSGNRGFFDNDDDASPKRSLTGQCKNLFN
jgi:hypothetical protein